MAKTEGGQMEAEPVIAVSIKMPDGSIRGLSFSDGNELEIGTLAQLEGILKALRIILKTPEGVSILTHAARVMQVYQYAERWYEEKPHA